MSATSFSWEREGERGFRLRVRTPVVRVGTLHRLAAAIYILDFDIVAGSVRTVPETGADGVTVTYSEDEFLIVARPGGQTASANAGSLALLMEGLLDEQGDVEQMFREQRRKPPAARAFFEAAPELIFETQGQRTQFYVEAVGRRGLLYIITRALAGHGVNVEAADIKTTPGGWAQDTFYVIKNGQPLDESLCLAVQREIEGI